MDDGIAHVDEIIIMNRQCRGGPRCSRTNHARVVNKTSFSAGVNLEDPRMGLESPVFSCLWLGSANFCATDF